MRNHPGLVQPSKMEVEMNIESIFIKGIANEYISETHPEEEEFLTAYLEHAEKFDFNLEFSGSQDIPFGFGGSELLDMFQSPVVIQVLLGVWKDIVVPLVSETFKKKLNATKEKTVAREQLMKALSRKKLRDYIRGQAKKKLLNDDDADELAERIMDWVRRHPEDLEHVISKSV